MNYAVDEMIGRLEKIRPQSPHQMKLFSRLRGALSQQNGKIAEEFRRKGGVKMCVQHAQNTKCDLKHRLMSLLTVVAAYEALRWDRKPSSAKENLSASRRKMSSTNGASPVDSPVRTTENNNKDEASLLEVFDLLSLTRSLLRGAFHYVAVTDEDQEEKQECQLLAVEAYSCTISTFGLHHAIQRAGVVNEKNEGKKKINVIPFVPPIWLAENSQVNTVIKAPIASNHSAIPLSHTQRSLAPPHAAAVVASFFDVEAYTGGECDGAAQEGDEFRGESPPPRPETTPDTPFLHDAPQLALDDPVLSPAVFTLMGSALIAAASLKENIASTRTLFTQVVNETSVNAIKKAFDRVTTATVEEGEKLEYSRASSLSLIESVSCFLWGIAAVVYAVAYDLSTPAPKNTGLYTHFADSLKRWFVLWRDYGLSDQIVAMSNLLHRRFRDDTYAGDARRSLRVAAFALGFAVHHIISRHSYTLLSDDDAMTVSLENVVDCLWRPLAFVSTAEVREAIVTVQVGFPLPGIIPPTFSLTLPVETSIVDSDGARTVTSQTLHIASIRIARKSHATARKAHQNALAKLQMNFPNRDPDAVSAYSVAVARAPDTQAASTLVSVYSDNDFRKPLGQALLGSSYPDCTATTFGADYTGGDQLSPGAISLTTPEHDATVPASHVLNYSAANCHTKNLEIHMEGNSPSPILVVAVCYGASTLHITNMRETNMESPLRRISSPRRQAQSPLRRTVQSTTKSSLTETTEVSPATTPRNSMTPRPGHHEDSDSLACGEMEPATKLDKMNRSRQQAYRAARCENAELKEAQACMAEKAQLKEELALANQQALLTQSEIVDPLVAEVIALRKTVRAQQSALARAADLLQSMSTSHKEHVSSWQSLTSFVADFIAEEEEAMDEDVGENGEQLYSS